VKTSQRTMTSVVSVIGAALCMSLAATVVAVSLVACTNRAHRAEDTGAAERHSADTVVSKREMQDTAIIHHDTTITSTPSRMPTVRPGATSVARNALLKAMSAMNPKYTAIMIAVSSIATFQRARARTRTSSWDSVTEPPPGWLAGARRYVIVSAVATPHAYAPSRA